MKTVTIPSSDAFAPNTTPFKDKTAVVPGQAPSPTQTQKFRDESVYIPGQAPSPVQTQKFRNESVYVPGSSPSPAQTSPFRNRTQVIPASVGSSTYYPPSTPSGPYAAWSGRKTLTDSNSTTVTDYVVQVSLTASNWNFAACKSDGSDLRFYDETTSTQIPWWIESYDSVGQTATIWVRVADMTHRHSVYFGNAAAAAFQIPPLGKWLKRSGGIGMAGYLPEQILKDDDGTLYATCSNAVGGTVDIYKCSTSDPWTGTWGYVKSLFSCSGMPCHVIKKGQDGRWYIIYASGATNRDIYCAWSATLTGTYSAGVKIISHASGSWDAYRVDEPYFAQRSDGRWVCLYMGDAGSNVEQVGYALSDTSDPTGTWTVSSQNPVIKFGSTSQYDAGTVADPYFYLLNGIYYVGYAASAGNARPWNIASATSSDLLTFTKRNIVLSHGDTGTGYDSGNAHRGSIYLHTDNYYYHIYAGFNGTDYTGGLARMSAYSTASGYPPEQVFDGYENFANGLSDSFAIHGGSGGSKSIVGSDLAIASGTGTFAVLQTTQNFRAGFQLELKAKHASFDGTSNHYGEIGFMRLSDAGGWSGSTLSDYVRLYSGGAVDFQAQTKSGATNTLVAMGQAVSASAYVVHRIMWVSSSQVLLSNDGNAATSITTNVPVGDAPAAAMSYASASNTSTLDVSYLRVRRYNAVEPAIVLS